jgi:NAD(P)-dependent dehydrogenase (short-subunit alcohol dehydrogenase family)
MRDTERADARLRRDNIFVTSLDVTDDASIECAVSAAAGRFGAIDVLLNNAGYGLFGALEAMSAEQIDRQLRTNVYGVMRMTQQVLPLMRARRQGVVLNISSVSGLMGGPYQSAYCATKFAIEGLSESLRYELAQFNIRVKLVEPGGIKTDFSTRSLTMATNDTYRSSIDRAMAIAGKFVESLPGPEEVAKVIFRAANDGSQRLRYRAKPGAFLLVRNILPDSAMRWLFLKAV